MIATPRFKGVRMSKKILRLACGVMILLILTAACSSAASSGDPTPTPLPQVVNYQQSIFTVERGPIVDEQDITAEVVPGRQDDLFFRTSGPITRVTVTTGNSFKKGDILAEMDVSDLVNQLQQAQINLEVAQSDMAKNTAQHEYDIQKAQTDVLIAKKNVSLAQLNLNAATGTDWSRAKLQLDIAQANEALAEQALKLASADITAYLEESVKQSQLAVDRLNGLIAERQIVAPYDGVVLKSTIRTGMQQDAFNIAFTVGDPLTMVVQAQYDSDLASKLTTNTEIQLYLNLNDQVGHPVNYMADYQAVQGDKSAQSSSGQDFIFFSLPKDIPASQITTGKNVKLAIILGKKDNALLLPPAAIRQYKGLYYVIVMNGDQLKRVEINQIGLQAKDKWEIDADLQAGDKVLGP